MRHLPGLLSWHLLALRLRAGARGWVAVQVLCCLRGLHRAPRGAPWHEACMQQHIRVDLFSPLASRTAPSLGNGDTQILPAAETAKTIKLSDAA